MEVAATVTTATITVAAVEVSTAIAMIEAASVAAMTVIAVSAAAVTVSATVVATTVIAVIPGAGADEDAAGEPVRAVVTIGRTGVGIVVVVAVGADWRGTVIGRRSESHTEGDALSVRVRSREERNTEN
jgi:hypothetical protein